MYHTINKVSLGLAKGEFKHLKIDYEEIQGSSTVEHPGSKFYDEPLPSFYDALAGFLQIGIATAMLEEVVWSECGRVTNVSIAYTEDGKGVSIGMQHRSPTTGMVQPVQVRYLGPNECDEEPIKKLIKEASKYIAGERRTKQLSLVEGGAA